MDPGVGTNRYSYSANDPINKLDPNGNWWSGGAPDDGYRPDRGPFDRSATDIARERDRLSELRNDNSWEVVEDLSETVPGEISGLSGVVSAINSARNGDVKGIFEGGANLVTGKVKAATTSVQALANVLPEKKKFESTDPHVSEVAQAIEDAYPGHVVGINQKVLRADGTTKVEIDILTKNAAIEVKSGGGAGITTQMKKIEAATGLPTIGYGPDLGTHVRRNTVSTNDLKTLIEVVKP